VETRANGRSGEAEPAGGDGERSPPGGAQIRTFLIADVRGYTRFTQERGDEEAGRLAATFAEQAREVIEACGGDLLELRGDEALSVFGSARQAIRGAVELQKRFRGPDSAFPLGIGIGLDAGEAVPVAGGFRGGALNLAARLCSVAGPGEILASETVTSLARHVDGVQFAPRRAVRLKGIDHPVRVAEVKPAVPLPPPPTLLKPRRRFPRPVALVALGFVVIAVCLGALALARSGEPEGLPGLDENAVGLVDTGTNRLMAQVALASSADGIAAGAGSVWVSNGPEGTVSRIEPATYDVHTIDVGGRPAGIAYGAGSLWVASSEDRAVAQVDPKSARVVQTIQVGNGPRAVAVGFGAVWVANSTDGTVSWIDLERGVEGGVVSVGGTPVALAASEDAVWVASETSGVVSRIGGRSREVVATVKVGGGPSAVAIGEGAIWVANRLDGTVSRIDPVTNSVTAAIPVGPDPVAVAVGDSTVWVAERGRGTLSRIDAVSGRVEDTVTVEASPAGLALLGDGLWTTALASLASHRGGTLAIESLPFDSVDPAVAYAPESWRIVPLAYDGLVGYRRVAGAAGATLVPNLATHIPTPTDDRTTYTFQLRPGIRYSNGMPVRAGDFRSSLERVFKVNPAAPLPYFQKIVGASACVKQPAECDLSKGIETDDETRTVTIHLTSPDSDFLYTLALPFASFVPAGSPPTDASDDPLPGTGPYRVRPPDSGGMVRLVRNPYFRVWSSDARPDGYPDEIVIRVTNNAEKQVAAVESGEADWAEVPSERIRALATNRASRLHSDPTVSTYYMFLNVRVPPFDDIQVRRALNYAADRAQLVELFGGSLAAQPTCQVVPPNIFGYRPYCPYTVDPGPAGSWTAPDLAKASRLVEASGTKGMKITVWTFAGQESIGRYFTSLLDLLGYAASLRVLDQGQYFSAVADSSSGAQIGTTAWFADIPSASNFVRLFSCESFLPASSGNINYSGLCDPSVDAAIDAAEQAQTLDPQAGGDLWAVADRKLTHTAAAVPFANLRTVVLVSERVGNYQHHPVWGTLLDQLWVR
jgi:YVTN family beta-propeller protein